MPPAEQAIPTASQLTTDAVIVWRPDYGATYNRDLPSPILIIQLFADYYRTQPNFAALSRPHAVPDRLEKARLMALD